MAETKTRNIYQRMEAITNEIATVGKNKTVSTGNGGGFKAVTERDVLDAVKPVEEKHGVFSYPFSREIVSSEWMEQESKYGKKLSNFIRVQTVYRFVNVDAPDEFVDVISWGDGIDTGDKAVGKAMTYSDKYALMKAYKISTGDDPDQEASGTYSRAPKPTRETAPTPTPAQEQTTGEQLLAIAKPSSKDWKKLYNLAATAGGVDKPSVDESIKKIYKCDPKDLSVEQFEDYYGKLEQRAAKMKAEREAAAAQVEE